MAEGLIFSDTSQHNVIRSGHFNLEIFSDASLSGWGASCGGNRTHESWSLEDKQNHINYLELLAVVYALRCFAAESKNCNVLLRVDNSTAISYTNRMGSIKFPHLSNLARKIWNWCADRNLFIYAAYIPSAQNIEADFESRVISDETEWTLEMSILRGLFQFLVTLTLICLLPRSMQNVPALYLGSRTLLHSQSMPFL